MSTATPSSDRPSYRAHPPRTFASELTQRYGSIPNGRIRILAPVEASASDPSLGPTYPRSARGYQRTSEVADGANWSHLLSQGKSLGVWDLPAALWAQKNSLTQAHWRQHFRGVLSHATSTAQPAGQGTSCLYANCPWFRPHVTAQTGKMAETRATYPRAYEHWSEEERNEVRRRVDAGDDYLVIAKDLQRQPDAVAIYLWKNVEVLARSRGIPKPFPGKTAKAHDEVSVTPASSAPIPPANIADVELPILPPAMVTTMAPSLPAIDPRSESDVPPLPPQEPQVRSPTDRIQPTTRAEARDEALDLGSLSPAAAAQDDVDLRDFISMPLLSPSLQEVYGPVMDETMEGDNGLPVRESIPPPIRVTAPATATQSPSEILWMAGEVRRELKNRGMGTRHIALIADLVRTAHG